MNPTRDYRAGGTLRLHVCYHEAIAMEPLPRRPGATSRPDHSYVPEQERRIGATLWMPIALALLLLIIGGGVWLSL